MPQCCLCVLTAAENNEEICIATQHSIWLLPYAILWTHSPWSRKFHQTNSICKEIHDQGFREILKRIWKQRYNICCLTMCISCPFFGTAQTALLAHKTHSGVISNSFNLLCPPSSCAANDNEENNKQLFRVRANSCHPADINMVENHCVPQALKRPQEGPVSWGKTDGRD